MKPVILIIDDEEQTLVNLEYALSAENYATVVTCNDSRHAVAVAKKKSPNVILLDLVMPHLSGQELLPQILETCPDASVIVVSALNDVPTAVSCMHMGAADYVTKPVSREVLIAAINRLMMQVDLKKENERLQESLLSRALRNPQAFEAIVTQDPKMLSIFSYIEAIAPSQRPVLITGETGTGKELVAQALHRTSSLPGKCIPVNTAGLDDTMFADTLFGHVAGAYTGANASREGLVKKAENGTLFLDEIGDLKAESQVKLLRLLQEGAFYPLGSDTPQRSNARIVAATNRTPSQLLAEGSMRKDLFYRLNTHHVQLPPLRERPLDITLLANHFVASLFEEKGERSPAIPPQLYTVLKAYPFPGNVRELESLMADACSLHKSGVLSIDSIRNALFPDTDQSFFGDEAEPTSMPPVTFGEQLPPLKSIEPLLIKEAMKRAEGNQTLAAKMLSVSRQTLNTRLNK